MAGLCIKLTTHCEMENIQTHDMFVTFTMIRHELTIICHYYKENTLQNRGILGENWYFQGQNSPK